MENYKLKIISVKDVEDEKEILKKLTATYENLIASLSKELFECVDPDEVMQYEHEKLIDQTTELNAEIINYRMEVKSFDESASVYKNYNQLMTNVDFACNQDHTAQRFKDLTEKIKAMNDHGENFENLSMTLAKREQNAKTQLESIKADIDTVNQEIEEINANQTYKELEMVLNQKKNLVSAIEQIDSKEINELATLLHETQTELKRLLQKNEEQLVTQESASPKPFFSQAYDPQKVRYTANFASQQDANLPRM